ncbi:hypothetical protein JHK87_040290 [Glycine soja]|nr:hypothetical protein JHK87_040290 [Glycine soja]
MVPESSSAKTPPNLILNIDNQNDKPMISSVGSSNAIIPMFLCSVWLFVLQTNSLPRQGPNTGLALQLPNNALENQVVQNQNHNPENHVEIWSHSLYDLVFEALGLAADPHIRLFRSISFFDLP